MTAPATKLTYQDYLLLPDDGKRYEIIDGELYMTPSPVTRHQTISGRLHYLFMSYLETHPIGAIFAAPLDVLLSDVDTVQPDLLFIHKE
jgi:Uma2 family endonuclease